MRELGHAGIRTPDGFTVTSEAYREFMRSALLRPFIAGQLRRNRHGADLLAVGAAIRTAFAYADMPAALARAVTTAYQELGGDGTPVVVRSGVADGDVPDANSAQHHEIFLNVRTSRDLLAACKRCFAVLFSDRAINLREEHGVDQLAVAMSVGVQRMVRSDLAGSGTVETLESEFPGLIRVSAVWGLGDTVIGGRVDPDEYLVLDAFPGTSAARALVSRRRGGKETKVVCAGPRGVRAVPTEPEERRRLVLDGDEVLDLARWAVTMERQYGGRPMTIEWAKDGPTGDLYVVHVRPASARREVNPPYAEFEAADVTNFRSALSAR